MEASLVILLGLLCAIIPSSLAICWTAGPYHLAASALATGVGNVSSSAVCVYGNDASLNSVCPFPCTALISATWGDCYCRDPNYQPNSGGADPFVKPLSVGQIFALLATNKYTQGASCRDWLSNNPQWKC